MKTSVCFKCVCVNVCFKNVFIFALCRVPAHKYVLATGSTVFYAMLYGGLADDGVDEISGEFINNTSFRFS
jgi:hypothetical protein